MPKSTPIIDHSVRRTRAVTGAAGAERVELLLHVGGADVPAILLLPAARPAPAALLLHGYSSRKEQMADSGGRGCLARGIATLAIDLPLHGEREGDVERESLRNPLVLVRHWKLALAECAAALRFLESHPAVDARRLALAGYSMGSFVGVIAASNDAAVRAVVLAAGGDLPAETPFAALVRSVADPLRAVRRLAGRPLLMGHGRRDRTVKPYQAERLFHAASEPKLLKWYDAGHWLPDAAVTDAAEWLAKTLEAPVRRTG